MAGQQRKKTDETKDRTRSIKCLVWDLDNTLWDGTLLEDGDVRIRETAVSIIKALDERGILQSIASRNDYDTAMSRLRELGLEEYFLFPQINWGSKASSIIAIAASINISTGAIAFIDDQQFERDEVSHSLSEVLCIDSADLEGILDRPEFNPRFVTEDSRRRRRLYLCDLERKKEEAEFKGSSQEFLESLEMVFIIRPASLADLDRVEELIQRTNQLNTTGYIYTKEELAGFLCSGRHKVMIAGLDDKYGTYGKIGICVIECDPGVWTIELLLISCRVMSRGVGAAFVSHVASLSRDAGVRLLAEFVPNRVNRMMYMTYKFAGFREVEHKGQVIVMENDLNRILPIPAYIDLRSEQ